MIVDAALQEFSEHGYERASLGTIAERAGITRTVLYSHFPSKHALFLGLLEDKQTEYLGRLREALDDHKPTNERLTAAVDAMLDFAAEQPSAYGLLYPQHAPENPEVAADHRQLQTTANRLLARMLAPDVERAGLDPRSPVARGVFAVQQAALHGLVEWWRAHPQISRADVREAAIKSLWLGIQGMERRDSD
jgi:AcrR family transcriptional regulator